MVFVFSVLYLFWDCAKTKNLIILIRFWYYYEKKTTELLSKIGTFHFFDFTT